DTRPRVDDDAGTRDDGRRRVLRWPAAAALDRRAPADRGDDEIDQRVVDVDVDEPRSVRRGERRVAVATARLAVLALAVRQDGLRPAVGAEAHDLEPAVGIGQVEEAAAGHRPRPRRPLLAA